MQRKKIPPSIENHVQFSLCMKKNQIVEKRKMRPSWFHQPIDSKRQFLRISRDKTLCIKNAREFYKKCGKTFQFFFAFRRTINLNWSLNLSLYHWLSLFFSRKKCEWNEEKIFWFGSITLSYWYLFISCCRKKKLKLYLEIFFLVFFHHRKKLELNLYIAIWLCECGASSFKD